ncbi:hypothetical protein N7516_002408 [Penicillium verrucosum]|uniref:uncharacterized protein n=1 Tax=Penicillium verrucosum TaxID=60171 RepID=UPI0025455DD8|nr:uncharacterized protein N7516_002408 [Penicillium verrucosum]KAJ5942240.1 hypothetical protein N7516_002408 [Penicillium verrucosum]
MTSSPNYSSGPKSPELYSLEPPDGRIAHTLTACTSESPDATPGFHDVPPVNEAMLKKARALEKELAKAENEIQHAADAELMVRGAGRIRFKENDEPRYLGASSGIAMTRLVMEMAKQNTDSKSIKDVVPEFTAQEIKDAFAEEDSKPTSKVYPMISSIPQPNLPPKALTYKLIDLFVAKAQAQLPLLHEPTFRQEVEEVFDGSTDPCKNFQLRMVIAISMQKMSTEYAGLADSYYLAALPYLEPTLKRLDIGALQCLVLIGSYSMVTPTRTAAYWVVGTAAKLCQDLGLTEEATVTKSPCGKPLNPLEVDMRRRLFWIVSSMEFGLSHSLGRCSSYCVSHDHINVKFPELVDDRYITAEGITPGAKPVLAKCIAVHFFKMRLLQLEPRRILYSNRRESPLDDQDPWFSQMLAKIDHWMATTPKNDDGSGLNVKWFQGRRNTIIVLMYRPSPQIPEPTINAAKICYDAAVSNIAMHKEQMITGSVDLTWVFVQALFMALNTVLWALSYPEIRKEHTIEEVQGHLDMALEVIVFSAERWPGVQSAFLLYRRLVAACLKAYRTEESFVVHSPSNHPTPTSSQGMTPPAMSSPSSSTTTSYYSNNHRGGNLSIGDTTSNGTYSRGQSADPTFTQESTPPAVAPAVAPIPSKESQMPSVSSTFDMHPPPPAHSVTPLYTSGAYVGPTLYPDVSIDPNTPYNTIPSVVPGLQGWDPNFSLASTTAGHLAYTDATVDPMNWSTSIGDQYSQYFNEPFPVPSWRERTLSQQEQIELLASLEHNIPDVSAQLVNEYNAYYQS